MPTKIGLHYNKIGVGKTIYFLHGMGLDGHSMAAFYEPRFTSEERHFARLYPDLPGMGNSPATSALQSADDVLAQVHAFIQATSEGPCYLVGHSYGGYLALGLLARFPNEFSGAFLTAPVVLAEKTARTVATLKHLISAPVTSQSPEFTDYQHMNVVINPSTWRQYQELILLGLKTFNRDFWVAMKNRHAYRLSIESRLSSLIKSPVTLVLGENDNEVGYQDQVVFAHKGAHMTTTVIPNAGHNLMIDAPEAVMTAFHQFLHK